MASTIVQWFVHLIVQTCSDGQLSTSVAADQVSWPHVHLQWWLGRPQPCWMTGTWPMPCHPDQPLLDFKKTLLVGPSSPWSRRPSCSTAWPPYCSGTPSTTCCCCWPGPASPWSYHPSCATSWPHPPSPSSRWRWPSLISSVVVSCYFYGCRPSTAAAVMPAVMGTAAVGGLLLQYN